ncbi:MAG TPA: Ig-like domain-containing protein [Gemmatimonadaceae bacterium]|nr:Ig-like domain-containing protein [Gemmatimonadaceae bacterium]
MSFIRLRAASALLILAAAACADATRPVANQPVASVTVVATTRSFLVGDTLRLSARALAADGSLLEGRSVSWSSSDSDVLQLSGTGLATAVAPGAATIRATVDGKTGSVDVAVSVAPVARVAIVETSVSLMRGGSQTLVAAALDAQGRSLEGRLIAWRSSDAGIVEVDAAGRLTARSEGEAKVFAESEGKADSVQVIVTPPTVGSVVITPAAMLFGVGGTRQLTATVLDTNGDTLQGRTVTWSVDNHSAAGITASGLLWGIAPGYVTITATCEGKTFAVAATIENGELDPLEYDLLYYRNTPDAWGEIMVLGTTGNAAPLRLNAGNVSRMPTASPDGQRIAFAVSMQELGTNARIDDIYAVDRNGMNMKRLTSEPGVDAEPAWSPKGDRIAYRRVDLATGSSSIWVMDVDGANKVKLTEALEGAYSVGAPSWSPDGTRIAFSTVARAGTRSAIWTMNADGSEQQQRTSSVDGFDMEPSWSAGGTQIAFSRIFAGDRDIAILTLASGSVQRLALPGAQWHPAWSPDGGHIAYWQPAGPTLAGIYTVRTDGSNVRMHTLDPSWGGGFEPTWIRRP